MVSYRFRGFGGPKTPPLTDPRWPSLAAPLVEFLGEPRDWPTIIRWSNESGYGPNLVRHVIAWAEAHHQAQSFYDNEVLYWASPRVSTVRLKVQSEAPVLGELDVGTVHGGLVEGDGEGEGDDDPVVPGVPAPEDEFVSPPLDDGDV